MRTFVIVVIAVGVVSIVQMWPSPSRQIVGTITDLEPGQWIRIANEQTDPHGFRISLSENTTVDGDRSAVRRDARVRIFYAHTGGGFVARRVSILTDGSRR